MHYYILRVTHIQLWKLFFGSVFQNNLNCMCTLFAFSEFRVNVTNLFLMMTGAKTQHYRPMVTIRIRLWTILKDLFTWKYFLLEISDFEICRIIKAIFHLLRIVSRAGWNRLAGGMRTAGRIFDTPGLHFTTGVGNLSLVTGQMSSLQLFSGPAYLVLLCFTLTSAYIELHCCNLNHIPITKRAKYMHSQQHSINKNLSWLHERIPQVELCSLCQCSRQ